VGCVGCRFLAFFQSVGIIRDFSPGNPVPCSFMKDINYCTGKIREKDNPKCYIITMGNQKDNNSIETEN
jgi:hypothetical protein